MKSEKKTYLRIILVLLAAYAFTLYAEPMTYYTRLTNIEETVLGEYIYYGSSDTLYGITRSNDFLPINGGNIHGPLITSEEIIFEDDHINLEDVTQNAEPFPFPEQLVEVMRYAAPWVPSQNNRLMTWIYFRGDQGIDIYQYPAGTPRQDSLFQHLQVPSNQVIYVDGDVEIQGVVAGQVTVYSSGNMFLIDNIQYVGSVARNGWFESQGFPHMLGLVSERNIIIEDNPRNGKENGWRNGGGGGPNNHSININGSLIALGGSFTFEHQNDEHERFQGPEPDERGVINLKGSVAQYRRGYLHRDNHGGTGYHTNFLPDERLRTHAPPGFHSDGLWSKISGRHDRLLLDEGSYTFTNVFANTLIAPAGVELVLRGRNALTVRDSVVILGSEEEPVNVRTQTPGSRSAFHVDGGIGAYIDIQHAIFSDEINVYFEFDTLKATSCRFERQLSLEGSAIIDSCFFGDQVTLLSDEGLHIFRSVFEGGMVIDGTAENGEITNNSFIGARDDGLLLNRFNSLRIVNNIIAYNRGGINNRHREQPELGYNCVFGNFDGDWMDCERGAGSISENPQMTDHRNFDYSLNGNSPCIDAGDPSSPLDPDQTRADIGPFYFDHEPQLAENPEVPEEFAISVFPIPFNRSLKVFVEDSESELVVWSIINIRGQMIAQGNWSMNAGKNSFELNNLNMNNPGVYFLQIKFNACTKLEKLIYIP
ncbi:MAG: T9SS type A sorting domain-containing protein [Calditrichaeota bacterium]|nr:T9SS type A sorting domain-containing protein [Calditrichota bacterium]